MGSALRQHKKKKKKKRCESSQMKFLHIQLRQALSHTAIWVKCTVTLTAHFFPPSCFSPNVLSDGVFVSCLIYVWHYKLFPETLLSSKFSPSSSPWMNFLWPSSLPPHLAPCLPPPSCPDFLFFSLSSSLPPSHLLCCFPLLLSIFH